jgi:acid phosphatase (class A)
MLQALYRTFLCLGLAGSLAWAQGMAPPRMRAGYLSPNTMPELTDVVPPPPKDGSGKEAADRAIYRATRSLEGTARWSLAQSDNDVSTTGILKAFSCALGVTPTAKTTPHLYSLLARSSIDGFAAFNRLKDLYQRKRPYLDEEGAVCISRSPAFDRNPDYPSGHATIGWQFGLILAELAPDAADKILERARAFGESRVVCGVHYASAVDAGWMTAAAVVAALHGSAAFRADLETARSELKDLRVTDKPLMSTCKAEAEALAARPY